MTEYRYTPEAELAAKQAKVPMLDGEPVQVDITYPPKPLVGTNWYEKYLELRAENERLSEAKAQARHLLKVLDEPCTEQLHYLPSTDKDGEWVEFQIPHRRNCPKCMAAIKREVGE